MPLVSICIPTYNHARFLRDAIVSASAQRFDDLEIVVVDNASMDETPEIAAEAASRDSRIRYFRHPQNIGLIGNFDACMRLASGQYIKFLCSDDVLESDCVPVMAEVLDSNPRVSIVACARTITDVNLAALRIVRARPVPTRIPGDEMIAECFFLGNRIGEPTAVMFRRSDAARGFRRSYCQLLDMEMWFHLLQKGDFFTLPQSLCRVRRHDDQASRINDREGRIVEERRLLYLEFASSAAKYGSLSRRCIWDFRMAQALARSQLAGYLPSDKTFREVYFQRAFDMFTRPVARLLVAAGLEAVRGPR